MRAPRRRAIRAPRPRGGIPLRTIAPNAVTALALCFGLTGVRYAIGAEFERAVTMILIAGVLDGIDGRVARMMRGESRFGAELDSLSDAISFGVAPALIVYLWSLVTLPRIGWLCALIYAVFCALRLARFNAAIDLDVQPHKSAGFLTGVPAPAGAGLAMLPIFIWLWSGEELLRSPWIVAPWMAFVAFLMASSLATYSWGSLKLRPNIRFEAILIVVLFGAALLSAPWQTLTAICVLYVATIPFSIASYRRVRRLRAAAPQPAEPAQG
ncbi:CDP-diacylglycerol--serine O-phosphatidyltransferase [Sphingomonas sp. BGYR3]|uniref:CDP-diacylglycerol--serine O-phosphatidyltransferase n=1 Tax=Sphingomonas sp. BGYR3 TaxID=2975483 RepID=UPI0021A69A84|nr:CDP-diacylglycerol--serine O-phosphatidyltransferase [Sphingomonas sp. BGYR3]MDG5487403.1 CDP-diacylglycerol--serine O-phosphatidyltransferase [Sphingomonas sp. BGYR3]